MPPYAARRGDVLAEIAHIDTVRTIDVSLDELFPRLERLAIQSGFMGLRERPLMAAVPLLLRDLAMRGGESYQRFHKEFGFYDDTVTTDECRFRSSAVATILAEVGHPEIQSVSRIECYEVSQSEAARYGRIVKVDPEKKGGLSPEKRESFGRLGRIPYCAVVVTSRNGGHEYIVSPKSIDQEGHALLVPDCYEKVHDREPWHHQLDEARSGVFLRRIAPREEWGADAPARSRIVWMKQGLKDEHPEIFANYLRMRLQ